MLKWVGEAKINESLKSMTDAEKLLQGLQRIYWPNQNREGLNFNACVRACARIGKIYQNMR